MWWRLRTLKSCPLKNRSASRLRWRALQEQLQKALAQVPRWEREFGQRKRELDQEVAGVVLVNLVDDLLAKYHDLPDVVPS